MVLETLNQHRVLGVVLAGGASRRFGRDKALALLDGVPVIDRIIARVRPQVGDLVLSGFARPATGLHVVPDPVPGEGPLAGIVATLRWAREHAFEMVASFPCDAPFVPTDLVEGLAQGRGQRGCAVAQRRGHRHYAIALWSTTGVDTLARGFDCGIRSLREGQALIGATGVEVDGAGPGGDPFFNINTPGQLALAEDWLRSPAEAA